METYVYEVLIRQQIADSNRAAALRHLVRAARARRAPSRWRAASQWFLSSAALYLRRPARRSPAVRVGVR